MTDANSFRESSIDDQDLVAKQRIERKAAREKERRERLNGKLTKLTFSNITSIKDGKIVFNKYTKLHIILGSKSQFDARSGRLRDVMPPLTCDCCQTFATLSAILLSSLGSLETLRSTCYTSTINYLLYISAWLHQLTISSWPQKGSRPTIGDLNTCLYLRQFFPSKVYEDEFQIVFHNQPNRVKELVRRMCHIHSGDSVQQSKRSRDDDGKVPICGYVIVSGDYTISIFAVNNKEANSTNQKAKEKICSFYLCDSHGTQPWSYGRACVSGLSFNLDDNLSNIHVTSKEQVKEEKITSKDNGSTASSIDKMEQSKLPQYCREQNNKSDDGCSNSTNTGNDDSKKKKCNLRMEEGIELFTTLLFTLLEEHRRAATTSFSTSSTSSSSSASAPLRLSQLATSNNLNLNGFNVNGREIIQEKIREPKLTNQIPYMTWTPVRRRSALTCSGEEIKRIIDEQWLPKVLSSEKVRQEARKYNFTPLECFWLLHNSGNDNNNIISNNNSGVKKEKKFEQNKDETLKDNDHEIADFGCELI